MKHRSPFAVFFLSLITLGIYGIYWLVKTKGELNAKGSTIPTAWLLIVPFVNIWWIWKYSEGVELVAKEKMNGIVAFILIWLLGSIGMAIIQNTYNGLDAAGAENAPTLSESPAASDTTEPVASTEPAPETTSATPAPSPDAPTPPSAPETTPAAQSEQQTPPASTPPAGLVQ